MQTGEAPYTQPPLVMENIPSITYFLAFLTSATPYPQPKSSSSRWGRSVCHLTELVLGRGCLQTQGPRPTCALGSVTVAWRRAGKEPVSAESPLILVPLRSSAVWPCAVESLPGPITLASLKSRIPFYVFPLASTPGRLSDFRFLCAHRRQRTSRKRNTILLFGRFQASRFPHSPVGTQDKSSHCPSSSYPHLSAPFAPPANSPHIQEEISNHRWPCLQHRI